MRWIRKFRKHQYERIPKVSESMNPKACQHEQNPKVSDNAITTQSDIANMIGISVDTLNNYKKLTELILEIQDLVDTGIVAPSTAVAVYKNE